MTMNPREFDDEHDYDDEHEHDGGPALRSSESVGGFMERSKKPPAWGALHGAENLATSELP